MVPRGGRGHSARTPYLCNLSQVARSRRHGPLASQHACLCNLGQVTHADVVEGEQVLVAGSLSAPQRTALNLVHVLQSCTPKEAVSARWMALSKAYGLPQDALDDCGLPMTLQQELWAMDSLVAEFEDVEEAVRRALALGTGVSIMQFGLLGLAMAHARCIREAAQLILGRPGLTWAHSRLSLGTGPGGDWLRFGLDDAGWPSDLISRPRLDAFCLTLDFAFALSMLRELSPPQAQPVRVRIPYLSRCSTVASMVGLPVQDGQGQACIELPPGAAEATLLRHDPVLAKQFVRSLEVLQPSPSCQLGDQAQARLWAQLPPPSRDELARGLGMSVRTLVRRLEEEGTNYAEILREVRRRRAQQMLRDRNLSGDLIAERLGYADAASFSRAFRTWEGVSPSAWRKSNSGLV